MIDLLISGAAVFALDHWSKRMTALHAKVAIVCGPLLQIRHVASTRLSYAGRAGRTLLVSLWLVAFASALILELSGTVFHSRSAAIGVGAALGGAAGNLLDVFRSGSVVDFIDVGWWPVFNIADVAIIAGLTLAFWPA